MEEWIQRETKNDKQYLRIDLSQNADETAYRTLLNSNPRFLPALNITNTDGKKILSYDISLDGYQEVADHRSLSADGFFALMSKLTDILLQCEDYFCYPSNFVLDGAHVYFNAQTNDVLLIYLPLAPLFTDSQKLSQSLYTFARNIAKTYDTREWQEVKSFLFELDDSATLSTMNKIYTERYTIIKKIEPITPVPTAMAEVAATSEPVIIRPEVKEEQTPVAVEPVREKKFGLGQSGKKESKPTEPSSASGGLFSGGAKPITSESSTSKADKKKTEKPAKANKPVKEPKIEKQKDGFSLFGKKNKPVEASVASAVLDSLDNDSDLTEVMSDLTEVMMETSTASLFLTEKGYKTGKIDINKSVFVLGRGRDVADYVFETLESDKKISRAHAKIETRGGEYFISHISSTQGTFTVVNHTNLSLGQEAKLQFGDIIKLGTRELVFEIHA